MALVDRSCYTRNTILSISSVSCNEPASQAKTWQRHESHTYHAIIISGRRFLKEAAYVLPKDHEEINRLDFQHYMLRQALKGNYLAPIEGNPSAILDIGCGTGRWCREIALQFPATQVYGLDLEELQTSTGPVPINYHFVQGNILERLPFEDEVFDFVHQRLLVAAIPAARWPEVIREHLRVTRRGGWIELVECGIEGINLGPLTQQFFWRNMLTEIRKYIQVCTEWSNYHAFLRMNKKFFKR